MLDIARCVGYRSKPNTLQICPKRRECKAFIEENKINPFFQRMVEPKFVQTTTHLGISADCENFTEFPL